MPLHSGENYALLNAQHLFPSDNRKIASNKFPGVANLIRAAAPCLSEKYAGYPEK